jgi:hypothetical protein
VVAAGADSLAHYNAYGGYEGRRMPGSTPPDISRTTPTSRRGRSPTTMQSGWQEGRDPSAGFDTLRYLAANPDVAAGGANLLANYLQFGIYEGRQAVDDGVWH